jgi:predicted dehydrogenase
VDRLRYRSLEVREAEGGRRHGRDIGAGYQMIHAAVVGLGRWGRNLVDASRGHERLKIVRAVEPHIDGARGFCVERRLDLTDNLETVLADSAIDAVLLATPHSLHPAQVVACAAARKQVFCEKPLALRRADAARMFDACREAGVALAVGHNRRFWPSMRALRETVASGELGTILHVEGHNSNENSQGIIAGWRLSPEESPGGGLTGAGLHVLDAFISWGRFAGSMRSSIRVSRDLPRSIRLS